MPRPRFVRNHDSNVEIMAKSGQAAASRARGLELRYPGTSHVFEMSVITPVGSAETRRRETFRVRAAKRLTCSFGWAAFTEVLPKRVRVASDRRLTKPESAWSKNRNAIFAFAVDCCDVQWLGV
jgi:hypothetical protein